MRPGYHLKVTVLLRATLPPISHPESATVKPSIATDATGTAPSEATTDNQPSNEPDAPTQDDDSDAPEYGIQDLVDVLGGATQIQLAFTASQECGLSYTGSMDDFVALKAVLQEELEFLVSQHIRILGKRAKNVLKLHEAGVNVGAAHSDYEIEDEADPDDVAVA